MIQERLNLYQQTVFEVLKAVTTSPLKLLYKPNIYFRIENDKYSLKVASNIIELLKVFILRYKCFLKDFGISKILKLDVDAFDFQCDHLIIKDKKSKKIIGTYRLNCSLFNDNFYTSTEFDINSFLARPGVKLELGRACVDSSYRNGRTIDLLFSGVTKYAQLSGSRYFFGCSSIHETCPEKIGMVMSYLNQKEQLTFDSSIQTNPKFQMNYKFQDTVDPKEAKKILPSLLRTYLSAGADVYSTVALDNDFECTDLLTIVDIEKMTPNFKRKYFTTC